MGLLANFSQRIPIYIARYEQDRISVISISNVVVSMIPSGGFIRDIYGVVRSQIENLPAACCGAALYDSVIEGLRLLATQRVLDEAAGVDYN